MDSQSWYNGAIITNAPHQVYPALNQGLITERDDLSMTILDSTTTSETWYLYVIQVASGPVKIGITDNVYRRLSHLQTANHEQLKLAYSFECNSTIRASMLEDLLHSRYSDSHIRGEWFHVNASRVIDDIQFAAQFLGIVNSIEITVYDSEGQIISSKSRPSFAPTSQQIKEVIRQFFVDHPEHMQTKLDELLPMIIAETGVKVGRTSIHNVRKEMVQ